MIEDDGFNRLSGVYIDERSHRCAALLCDDRLHRQVIAPATQRLADATALVWPDGRLRKIDSGLVNRKQRGEADPTRLPGDR